MNSQSSYLWRLLVAVALVVTAALLSPYAQAREYVVEADLQTAIDNAAAGDILLLTRPLYQGPIKISKPLSLIGSDHSVIKGNDAGSVITVTGADAIIRGVTVTGSGLSLASQDSGIFLDKTATRSIVENNIILNNLIGIYVSGAKDSLVRRNVITGRQDLRMNERGNGVQVWNAPGAIIEGNDIRFGRDGIFVTTSKKNTFRGNRMRDLRFAIHYMYTDKSEVIGNYSIGNHIGYALMSSTHLIVTDNVSIGDRDRALLFNFANKVSVKRNIVKGGSKKCIFIYNSNKNLFEENLLSDCEIGIHFTAGSERNSLTKNAFVNNQTQVKYVGTRWLEWSVDGIGNYWSDHTAFDLDQNNLADSVYRPNDLTDRIIWQYPSARLLINSPAVQLLKYAQSAFPAVHPGGVVDSAALMQMPKRLAEGKKGWK